MEKQEQNQILLMLGRMDAKLDAHLENHKQLEVRTSSLEQKVDDLSQWKSGVIGRVTVIVTLAGAIWTIVVGYLVNKFSAHT